MVNRIYFVPGMFGFARLASYEYFVHVQRALAERLGANTEFHVVEIQPTESVRRQAAKLVGLVKRTCGNDDGAIHLLGHSTGGLTARLAASPSAHLPVEPEALDWSLRLHSVTTINTPHHGTPLASFFATVKGQRMLYAVSALTFAVLSVGAPPLAAASALVALLGRLDDAVGIELSAIDRVVNWLLQVFDDVRSHEVRAYLDAIKQDQGAIIQVMPEAMDLFIAGVEDRPNVLYQSTASMAPPQSPHKWLFAIGRPWVTLSSVLFATMHGITSRHDERYPCAPSQVPPQAAELLARLEKPPDLGANDGVVPMRSQIWGKLAWAGYADHLDVLGHFRGPAESSEPRHSDWLTSGSNFGVTQFAQLMDAVAHGIKTARGST
jgi:triacylglycerol lipase